MKIKNGKVFTLKVHYILNEASSWNFDHTLKSPHILLLAHQL